MVFSSDPRDLEDISLTLEDYLKINFKKFLPIDIQKFFTLNDSSKRGYALGRGGEILLIFDRRLCPRDTPLSSRNRDIGRVEFTQMALKMSKDYCDKANIPYIQYEGEMRNRMEEVFIRKIDGVKNKMSKLIEEELSKLPLPYNF